VIAVEDGGGVSELDLVLDLDLDFDAREEENEDEDEDEDDDEDDDDDDDDDESFANSGSRGNKLFKSVRDEAMHCHGPCNAQASACVVRKRIKPSMPR